MSKRISRSPWARARDLPREPNRAPAAPDGPDLGGEVLEITRPLESGEDALDGPAVTGWEEGGRGVVEWVRGHVPDGGGGGVT